MKHGEVYLDISIKFMEREILATEKEEKLR